MVVAAENVFELVPHDRLTRFGSRERLLVDLGEAMRPDGAPQVLALFALTGFHECVANLGRPGSQALLGKLSSRLEQVVGPAGSCYWPREDEFALLCDAGTPGLDSLLERAAAALSDRSGAVAVTGAYGAVAVPTEAGDPLSALQLADARLSDAQPGREPRDRRQPLAAVRRLGSPTSEAAKGADDSSAEPLQALQAELSEAAASRMRMWQVDQLLDLARTLTELADAARIDDGQTGGLQGQPRDAPRIPLLLKELGLKLAALRALGGPEIPGLSSLVEEGNPRAGNTSAKVIAALDEIGAVLASA
jgi:GGDEF domain-containing protein